MSDFNAISLAFLFCLDKFGVERRVIAVSCD